MIFTYKDTKNIGDYQLFNLFSLSRTEVFQFLQNGHMVQLNVPLLTIVPIPYIAIQDIDINFKANISASSSNVSEQSSSSEGNGNLEAGGGIKVGPFHMDAKMNASYSSKKDSKATQDSKYSVEYTMDVAVKAGQESMPAGLAKVLELLGSALDVSDPEGTLEVNAREIKPVNGKATLIATFKNNQGVFDPSSITAANGSSVIEGEVSGDSKVFTLDAVNSDITVKAGSKEIKVKVIA